MIYALIVVLLGVGVHFAPDGWRWPFIPAAIILFALYVRAMNKRARRDVR